MHALTPAQLARVLRVAADAIDDIARENELSHADWIAQDSSPLGRRRHCAAVRARVARGQAGAAIVGRRHLLSPEALREALGEVSEGRSRSKKAAAQEVLDPVERMRARLRVVGSDL